MNNNIIIERSGKNIDELSKELIEKLPIYYQKNNVLDDLGEVLTDSKKIWTGNKAIDETYNILDKFHKFFFGNFR